MAFEDLAAWQKARELVNTIYKITRETTPAGDLGLSGQIQRAAVSVMSNVAEGFERHHAAEKLQAYNVARASCGEVRSLLYVIDDNYQADKLLVRHTRGLVVEVGRLTSGLIASTKKRILGRVAGLVVAFGLMALLSVRWLL